MRRLILVLSSIFILTVFASCIDRPDCVLDESQLADVLVDVHRAEGLLELQQNNTRKLSETDQYQREVIAAVLAKHGVTRQQYDSTMMWYAQHLKLLTRVYAHVDERLNDEHDRWSLLVEESRSFAVSQAGDSVELWTLRPHLVLDRQRYQDLRFWEIASDSNYVAGDTLRWQFVVRGLREGQKVIAQMSLDHEGTIGQASRVVDRSGRYQLTVQPDSVQSFTSAILALVLKQDSTCLSPVFVDSLSLVRLHPLTPTNTDAE